MKKEEINVLIDILIEGDLLGVRRFCLRDDDRFGQPQGSSICPRTSLVSSNVPCLSGPPCCVRRQNPRGKPKTYPQTCFPMLTYTKLYPSIPGGYQLICINVFTCWPNQATPVLLFVYNVFTYWPSWAIQNHACGYVHTLCPWTKHISSPWRSYQRTRSGGTAYNESWKNNGNRTATAPQPKRLLQAPHMQVPIRRTTREASTTADETTPSSCCEAVV